MRLFVDRNAPAGMKRATPAGMFNFRQKLKEAEALASTTLRKYIDILECCVHHFGTARRQRQEREHQEHNLPRNALLIQLDFMENMTWPLGPEEAQGWFWATSRESMTTLGFYVVLWAKGKCLRQNWRYISQVLNHDSAYACQCSYLGATLVKLYSLLVAGFAFGRWNSLKAQRKESVAGLLHLSSLCVSTAQRNDLLNPFPLDGWKSSIAGSEVAVHIFAHEFFIWNLSEQCEKRFQRALLHFLPSIMGKDAVMAPLGFSGIG